MKPNKTQIQFANSATGANGHTGTVLIGFCNEISIGDDGWAMIAPYGDHPSTALIPDAGGRLKKEKAIQRIDKAGADEMVRGFHQERRGIRKFLKGCNIYVGHPDMPGLGHLYPDKEPKGVFADMEARSDGLYGLPVFTNEGSEIVESKKLRAFSARIGESEAAGDLNGLPVYRPTKIYSAGLTNNPHLPVHFFNEDNTLVDAGAPADSPNPKPRITMKKQLLALCAKLGIQFANEADDAQTEAALDQINLKVAAFVNEKATLDGKVADAEGKIVTLTTEKATVTTERDTARTQFANERQARIKDVLAQALTSGRITAAEKPQWENRLKVEAQFANEHAALMALAPKVKTESVITVIRAGKETQIDISNPQARAQFVNEVLRDLAKETGLNVVKNHTQLINLAASRHPALFENIPHVEIKMPGGKK